MPIITYNNGVERKIIGTLDPERKIFSKKVSTSKHLLKKLDAWGIDAEYLHDVLSPQGYTIKITDIEEKVRYIIPAADMLERGTFLHFKAGDRDFGAQVFLPRSLWKQEPFVSKTRSFQTRRTHFKAPPRWPKVDK